MASTAPVTHVKTIPWAVYAQSVKGHYELWVNQKRVGRTAEGGAFLVPANHQMKIVHHTINGAMEINWLHIQCTLFGTLDILSLMDLPLILSPVQARPLGEMASKVRALQKKTPTLESILESKKAGFDIVRKIALLGTPRIGKESPAAGLERLRPLIEGFRGNHDKLLDLADMARLVGLSVPRLHALFKSTLGVSPHRYFADLRLKQAAIQLMTTELSVDAIGLAHGYDDPFHFSRNFKKWSGLSPTAYRIQREQPGA
ncbi:MAG: helix-turn-helix transcriptional regulator [Fibrobacteres bacterium]|nr:helix-turn-helix transcriptional regulator [Fibrobacterota bacterium]